MTRATRKKTGIAFVAAALAASTGGYFWHRDHTPEALMDRGQALQWRDRFKDAVPLFREATQRRPNDPLVHYRLADALMRFNDVMVYYPATAHTPATDIEEGNLPPQSQLHQAIAEVALATRLAPQEPGCHDFLATLLDRAGETQAAIAEWRKTLALLPRTSMRAIGPHELVNNAQQLAGDYADLASDLTKTGAIAEADQDYQAALRWEPTCDGLRLEYANFLNDNGRHREAHIQWQKIVMQNHYEAPKAKAMLAKYPEQP